MPARKLSDAEIAALLPKAKGWGVVSGKLHREFTCKERSMKFSALDPPNRG